LSNNILYISYDGLTDPLGQSQVLPYIVGLTRAGYKITIISCEKRERYNNLRTHIQNICDENTIDWAPLFYTKNPPVLSTLVDILKINRAAKKIYTSNPFAFIHCRSYIPALVGLRFKKKYNIKFIFDMRGFWADERIDGNIWKLSNPIFNFIYKFFKAKEKAFLSNADKIISLTHNAKKEILSWNLEVDSNRIVVIPCAADYSLFELSTEEKKNTAKASLKLSKNYVLSYIGSLGTWYLTNEMLHFFSLLKKQISNAKFLIITQDNPEIILKNLHLFEINEEDIIIKSCSRNELPNIAHSSDFSIFFIKPSYSKKASSPTKMGELLAMGIPIICNNNVGDVEEIIRLTKGGICIETLNDDAFKNTINQMLIFKNSPKDTRVLSEKYFLLENGVRQYIECYKSISV